MWRASTVGAEAVVKDVKIWLYGDVTGDGTINILDLIRFKKILANAASDNYLNTDLDGNGKIDSADLIMLKKMLLNFDNN